MPKHSQPQKRSASPEALMKLLTQHIPPFVMQRLRPWKERLRNNMQALPPEQQDELRAAIRTIELTHQADFQTWGELFITLVRDSSPEQFVQRLTELPDPPEEPSGVWQHLLKQAHQTDIQGIAASLVLYNLGCARAVRQFKQRYQ